MPIAATDLIQFSAASMPENDVSTSGGAVSTVDRPDLTQLTANSVLAAVSDGADTRTLTLTGRLATGAIDTEALVLTGATEVVGVKVFERILKVVLSAADGVRTVTLRQGAGGATRATLTPNETTRRVLFVSSASDTAPTVRYEKTFHRNGHGTLSLLGAQVTLTADPAAKVEIGLAAAVNDSGSVAARTTAPVGVTFVDDSVAQSVPGTDLAAGAAIGTWYKLSLGAGDAPQKTTVTSELAGTTT